MKRFLKTVLLTMLVLLVAAGVCGWALFGSLVKGAASVEKLDEGLYYMEYRGEDGFAGLMEQGGGRSAVELVGYVLKFLSKGFFRPEEPTPAGAEYGCSALTVRTPEGGVLMGRNFDWSTDEGEVMDERGLTNAIFAASQTGTAWTAVMDLTHPAVTYYSRRHVDKPFRFALERN